MTHYDPKPGKLFYNDPKQSIRTFYFPKLPNVWAIWYRNLKVLCLNLTRYKGVFKVADFEFWQFFSEMSFIGQIWSRNVKILFWNENPYNELSGANYPIKGYFRDGV